MLRALPAEAKKRGSRLVSAQAMQARLFSVYDAAAAAEDALALVQQPADRDPRPGLLRGRRDRAPGGGARFPAGPGVPLDLTGESWSRRAGKVVSESSSGSTRRPRPTAGCGGQTRSLRVAMMSTGRWSPSGTGMACRWVTPAWRKPAMRSAT